MVCNRPSGVFVVADQARVRVILASGLRRDGIETWTAADGGEAIESYRTRARSLALVLLDAHLPGGGGPRTLAALRAIDPAARIWALVEEVGRYLGRRPPPSLPDPGRFSREA